MLTEKVNEENSTLTERIETATKISEMLLTHRGNYHSLREFSKSEDMVH